MLQPQASYVHKYHFKNKMLSAYYTYITNTNSVFNCVNWHKYSKINIWHFLINILMNSMKGIYLIWMEETTDIMKIKMYVLFYGTFLK